MKKGLKIGIVVPSHTIEAWQAECILAIEASSDCKDVLVLVANDDKILNRRETGPLNAFKVYSNLDQKLFKLEPNAFENRKLEEITNQFLDVVFKFEKNKYLLGASVLSILKEQKIDLIINLSEIELQNDPSEEAFWRICQFVFGDRNKGYGQPMGFWEVMYKEGDTSLELIMDLNKGKKISLYRGTSLTQFKSVSRNNQNILWKTPSILKRELDKLSEKDFDNYFSEKEEIQYSASQSFLLGYPRNLPMIEMFIKMVIRILKDMYSKRRNIMQWVLLLGNTQSESKGIGLQKFKRIYPPKDRYWADPFLFIHEGKRFVFFEELYYQQKKGFISVFELDQNGEHTAPLKVMELDYHISYPFVFEEGGTIYMIPESSANKTIQLYKSTVFPKKWVLERVLMKDVIAVDTTLLKFKDKYWLFTNISGHEGTSTYDDLYLFYADELTTDQWISHPQNPIVTDVKNARPAGKIFWKNGKMYRPAQNCSHHYGYGIQINEILEISETTYKEKIVESILPNWAEDLIATHTINSQEDLVIADALIKR